MIMLLSLTCVFLSVLQVFQDSSSSNDLDFEQFQRKNEEKNQPNIKCKKLDTNTIFNIYNSSYYTLQKNLERNKELKLFKVIVWCILDLVFKINYRADLTTQKIYDNNGRFIKICNFLRSKVVKNTAPSKLFIFFLPYFLDKNYYERILCNDENHKQDFETTQDFDIYRFNRLIKKLVKQKSNFYCVDPKNYVLKKVCIQKERGFKSKIDMKKELFKLFNDNDFIKLTLFTKSLKAIIEDCLNLNETVYNQKAIHHVVSNMLIEYKSTIFLLFDNKQDVFRKEYIPRYKLIILKNLQISLYFSSYILVTKSTKEVNLKKFIIYKLFLYTKDYLEQTNSIINLKLDLGYFLKNNIFEKIEIKFRGKAISLRYENNQGRYYTLENIIE
ncbi:hypothetical protein TUBRATIS_13080 [Tubulinosema ratisbonensis]|uniref:Transmembrane protein n=1 Tax=Tubulinosema ratisbonensis TaxID=291195 RepID=A0A437ALY1_9MICR|nr:hypothetical protein TUBRATIS_13080 [Tubulinosema ratisbonensis]